MRIHLQETFPCGHGDQGGAGHQNLRGKINLKKRIEIKMKREYDSLPSLSSRRLQNTNSRPIWIPWSTVASPLESKTPVAVECEEMIWVSL